MHTFSGSSFSNERMCQIKCGLNWICKGYCINIRAKSPCPYFNIIAMSREMKNTIKYDKVTVIECHRCSRSPLRNIRGFFLSGKCSGLLKQVVVSLEAHEAKIVLSKDSIVVGDIFELQHICSSQNTHVDSRI